MNEIKGPVKGQEDKDFWNKEIKACFLLFTLAMLLLWIVKSATYASLYFLQEGTKNKIWIKNQIFLRLFFLLYLRIENFEPIIMVLDFMLKMELVQLVLK